MYFLQKIYQEQMYQFFLDMDQFPTWNKKKIKGQIFMKLVVLVRLGPRD